MDQNSARTERGSLSAGAVVWASAIAAVTLLVALAWPPLFFVVPFAFAVPMVLSYLSPVASEWMALPHERTAWFDQLTCSPRDVMGRAAWLVAEVLDWQPVFVDADGSADVLAFVASWWESESGARVDVCSPGAYEALRIPAGSPSPFRYRARVQSWSVIDGGAVAVLGPGILDEAI